MNIHRDSPNKKMNSLVCYRHILQFIFSYGFTVITVHKSGSRMKIVCMCGSKIWKLHIQLDNVLCEMSAAFRKGVPPNIKNIYLLILREKNVLFMDSE